MKALKLTLKWVLFLALLAAPVAARWFWFHRGTYQPPQIATLDPSGMASPTLAYQSFADQPRSYPAYILIDRGHENNLQVDDLTPLLDRLAARGAKIEDYDYESTSLADELRGATAFLVIAPTYPFYAEEAQAVQAFVQNGGLLLLVADPTRSVPSYSEYGYIDLYSLFFPESAIPAVNSLANRFGLSFYEDYLYNLTDYETNYRNIKISHFAKHPLTAGLDQLVLFATHSLKTDGVALFTGDANTLSNVRSAETDLPAAALSPDGHVLALGDLNLLLSPYHRAADNDHFLSNLADWLASPQRVWKLRDFPYLFQHITDLVPILPREGFVFEPAVYDSLSPLQETFAQAGKKLEIREQAASGHDVLYVGAYLNIKPVQEILASAGISVTLAAKAETQEETDTAEEATPTPEPKSILSVKGVGDFDIAGTLLFLVDQSGSRTQMVVLGEDEASLAVAMERLSEANFSGCLSQANMALCSTEPAAMEGYGESTPKPPAEKDIFILVMDRAKGGRSSGPELELALTGYNYTIWYTSQNGMPSYDDFAGYKVYILDTGDFAYDSTVMEEMPYAEGNVLLIGEQPFDPLYVEGAAPLTDIQVTDSAHPLAAGFTADQVITLLESSNGVPALILSSDTSGEGVSVVFSRGPASENAGAPVVMAYDYPEANMRYVYATFAFYRLPEDLQATFITNAVNWLMGK